MAQDWQEEVLQKLEAYHTSGKQDLDGSVTYLPVEHYLSKERLELELRHVFRKFPILVGFSVQVKNPGDFITHDLTGVPIIVTRTQNGELKAFLNACRHRGCKVVDDACGSRKSALICKFHGWSYDLDGKLRGVPNRKLFPNVDFDIRGLVPVPVIEVAGIIFARMAPGPEIPPDFLGPIADQFLDLELDKHVIYESSSRQGDFNWKMMVDANLEIYHVPVLHKNTAGVVLDNPMLYDRMGTYGRILVPCNEVSRGKVLGDPPEVLQSTSIFYAMFPNCGVYFLDEFVHVISTFPVDENHSVIRGTTLVPDRRRDDALRKYLRGKYDGYWMTMVEDMAGSASVHAGLRSGANREVVLGLSEAAVAQFHANLNEAIEGRLLV